MEYQRYLDFAITLAQEAGQEIKQNFKSASFQSVDVKDGPCDLVTSVDKAVEKAIREKIAREYPSHKFIGEEDSIDGICELTEEPTWVVDPIGRFPFVACSIALVIHKEVVVGVVYNPILEQVVGGGAALNKQLLSPRKPVDMSASLIISEFGSSRDPATVNLKVQIMTALTLRNAHGIRCVGSAALSMSMVAAGSADGYWEMGIKIWDIAAAALIVQESGGYVSSLKKSTLDLQSGCILAAQSSALAQEMQETILAVIK